MHKTPTQITRHIHDNFWIVISYALARPAATTILTARFEGEWKYLNKSIYEHAELRADRALLEMAIQIRVLDDRHKLETGTGNSVGLVKMRDGKTKKLSLRQMTNKVIHGAAFEWQIDGPDDPKIIVVSDNSEDWITAEIDVISLMGHIGQFMFSS